MIQILSNCAASERMKFLYLIELKWKFLTHRVTMGKDPESILDFSTVTSIFRFRFDNNIFMGCCCCCCFGYFFCSCCLFVCFDSMEEPVKILECLKSIFHKITYKLSIFFSCRRKCRSFHGCFPGLPWWYVFWMDWNGPWKSTTQTKMYFYIPQGRVLLLLSWECFFPGME